MSILKFALPLVAVLAIVGGALLFVKDTSFRAGREAARAQCSEDALALRDAQLKRLEELAEQHASLLREGQAAAAEADQALARRFEQTFRDLEKLRAQPIEVRADCRRDYDAVRLYKQAASGSARD